MALGGDQGGSIRIPAAFCGIYGMKPTHGLVPYTGIMPIELTLDHTGPMTATVEDNALLLEVLAGPDGLDPRQYGAAAKPYREALGRGAGGLRIARRRGGLRPFAIDAASRCDRPRGGGRGSAGWARRSTRCRSRCTAHGSAIWLAIAAEGATMQMMLGNGFGFNWQGLYVTSMLDFHSAWRSRADELSDTLKNTMLLGHYMVTRYRGHYYAKAQNLVRRLRRAYDEVLARYDLLLMPTLPIVATPLPEANAPVARDPAARLRDVGQHRAIRLHPPSGDEPALRHGGRPAGRHDAGRPKPSTRRRSTAPPRPSRKASTGSR